MKKVTIFLFLFFVLSQTYAQSRNYESFIPAGWITIVTATGDLNKDGIEDKVVIIENTSSKYIKADESYPSDTLNLNPRTILVLFKNEQGIYSLIEKNENGFVPTANSDVNTCLADPLMENGSVAIENGVLKIQYNYWLSCGSWFVNNATYTFRFQNAAMELIGFDHSEFHRASGESSERSINFSTQKKSTTTGLNEFERGKSKVVWGKIKTPQLLRLNDCDDETYFEVLDL